jgi:hypothetical protein
MKLSTLLLSSAALVVAGSAYAADLPAKKGAPAAKPATGCPAFGAGFFQIPGSDNCIKFSGRVTADIKASDPKGDRTKSTVNWGSGFRLNVDVRSNTDAGTLRSYGRLDSGSLSYAYVQLGGLSAGKQDTAFAGYNGDVNWNADGFDDGAVGNAISYTAALGGSSSATISVEDPTAHNNAAAANLGAAQMPDIVANLKTTAGAASLQLSAAAHQNYGVTGGSKQGFAVQAYGKIAAGTGTTLYGQLSYADAATSYLGFTNSTPDYSTATVDNTSKGYAALAAISQAAGAGNVNLSGRYGVITPSGAGSKDTKITQIELNYDYTGIKGFQLIPMVYSKNVDDGTNATNSVAGLLRIERDF